MSLPFVPVFTEPVPMVWSGSTSWALGLVLQQSPWDLTPKDPVGGHPLDGGVLVFDLPGSSGMGMTCAMNFSCVGLRHQLKAKPVQVTLRSAPGASSSTEVTMYADLRPGVRPERECGIVVVGKPDERYAALVQVACLVEAVALWRSPRFGVARR